MASSPTKEKEIKYKNIKSHALSSDICWDGN